MLVAYLTHVLFSCGRCVEDWTVRDDPSSLAWHDGSCEFVTGRDARNIAIGKYPQKLQVKDM